MIITHGKATKFCAKKWKNKSEKRKKNEKKLRKKDRKKRKKKRKLAQQVTNSIFLQNECWIIDKCIIASNKVKTKVRVSNS